MKALVLAVSFLLCAAAGAQELSLLDTSRALRAETRTAAAAGDWEAARRTNEAALALQPGHSGLLNNAVLIAGFAGDTEAEFRALERIAAAGLGFDLSEYDGAQALGEMDEARLAGLAARFVEIAAPVGDARLVAEPPLKDALIEALAVDSETERLFLGSVADRRIYRVDPYAPREADVFAGQDETIGSIFGLAIDRRSGRLYAAEGVIEGVTPVADGEAIETAVLALDLETGALIERYTIEGAQRIADVFVRDAIVYATDPDAGRIYRLNGPDAQLELYAEDPRFGSLQGVVSTRGAVFAVDYALGLWRIAPLERTATLMAPPPGASLIGLDGMAVDRAGRIFVIRNGGAPGGLFELDFDRDGALAVMSAVLTGDDRLGEPVTVRLTDGRAFVIADAQWRLFEGEDADPAARTNPQILAVPLPRPR
jgi:hypothetical protein